MATFQNVIDNARVFLKDADKVRYTDAQMLVYANEAVREARRLRPDFFFGTYATALSTYALSDTFPLPDEYSLYVSDFLVGRAEMVDDEYANESRAIGLMNRLRQGLIAL
jgi:hypothetical protein